MALKDVIIGYAKGDKGDKGDAGERGATGQTGPQGEPGNIADAAITDTQGLDVAKGTKTTAQKLFDAIADRIVNKLVTNDTLTTKLADYLLKSAMSSTNIDSTTNVPTSALVYSLMQDVNNNLSNAGITTVKKITDLYAIKKSGFYCYDAGASNAPMSSRGGMVIANYLSDAWISLNVVPYALSKIYTNSKYNSTWTGWSELASKDDLATKLELVATDFLPLTAATIQPNNYTYFIFNPSLPSGYILVGACLKDTNALARKVVPVYCNASSSNGTHRINLQLANTSNDVVSITADMAIAFYLFVRKK